MLPPVTAERDVGSASGVTEKQAPAAAPLTTAAGLELSESTSRPVRRKVRSRTHPALVVLGGELQVVLVPGAGDALEERGVQLSGGVQPDVLECAEVLPES